MASLGVVTLFLAIVFSSHLVGGKNSKKVQTFSKTFTDSISAKDLTSLFDLTPLTVQQRSQNFVSNVLFIYEKYGVSATSTDAQRIRKNSEDYVPYLTQNDWIKLYGESMGKILSDNGVLKKKNSADLANEFANFIDYVNKFRKDGDGPAANMKVSQEAYVSFLYVKNLFSSEQRQALADTFVEVGRDIGHASRSASRVQNGDTRSLQRPTTTKPVIGNVDTPPKGSLNKP